MSCLFTDMKTLITIGLLTPVFFLASLCYAADIASSVREGRVSESENYLTFQVGAVAGYFDNPHAVTQRQFDDAFLDLDISGEARYKRFFVEASQGTQDGLSLGYTIWNNQDWSVDFIGASMVGFIEDIYGDDSGGFDEASRNKRIEERETFYMGTGVRVTRYLEEYVIQYRLVKDTYKDHGVTSTLRVGRGWQIKNWNISSILSAKYSSQETNDYFFGVTEREATNKYPAFEADEGMSYSLMVSATKPLSERWVMRAFVGYAWLCDGISDSPVLEADNAKGAALAFNYVFF